MSFSAQELSGTYDGRPYTGDGHIFLSFSLEIHGQALGEYTHADFTHGIRSLASEKPRIYRWADDDDSPSPPVLFEVR